ncbi:MAG: helix-turn-helix domain-containing protein [Chloroflexi bacterium]|nr:helix-turn-helix domain-containing protein [Chloroflexota bacterium]
MRVKKINPLPDQLSENEMMAMQFKEGYVTTKRRSPTTREISAAIHLSVSATHDLIQRLIEYGYLARKSRRQRHRNYRVLRSTVTS